MPSGAYKNYLKIKIAGEELDAKTAKCIAKAIKNWALDHGATHYTHWFAPFTGRTAEKQVSFIEIDSKGNFIEDFNEKELKAFAKAEFSKLIALDGFNADSLAEFDSTRKNKLFRYSP